MEREALFALLRKLLASENAADRYETCALIGDCRTQLECEPDLELMELVVPLLQDKEPDVRYDAAQALGRLGFPEALPALRYALDDDANNPSDPGTNVAGALARAIRMLEKAQ